MKLSFFAFLFLASSAFAAWPDLSAPPAQTGGGEKDVAVVVGIGDYVFVPKIPGAVDNANDWYLYLTRTRAIPAERTRLLRDDDATKETLLEEAQWAASQALPGGTLWFVFIGHGAPAKSGNDGVLVGVDAQQRASSLYARSMAQSELLAALQKGKQAHTVVVLDACFSGRTQDGTALVPGLQPVIAVKAVPTNGNVTVLTAGSADQFAGPLPGLDRPAFSYLMLGALRGWGDANHDGNVTAEEATSYATGALATLVKDRRQTPQRSGADPGVLAKHAKESGPDLIAMVVSGGRHSTQVAEKPDALPTELLPPGEGESAEVARRRAACLSGRADECANYGGALYAGMGVKKDPVRAFAAHSVACHKNNAIGCLNVGALLHMGDGTEKNERLAVEIYGKACEGGQIEACNLAGMALDSGSQVPQDLPTAAKWFEKACDRDAGDACYRLGNAHLYGRGVKRDVKSAAELFDKACRDNSSNGCVELATLYDRGFAGVPADPEKAKSLLLRACQLGNRDVCDHSDEVDTAVP